MATLNIPDPKYYDRKYHRMMDFKNAMCAVFCTDERKCRKCILSNLSEYDFECMTLKDFFVVRKKGEK